MKQKIIFCVVLFLAISLISCAPSVNVDKEYEKELIVGEGYPTINLIDDPTKCTHRTVTIRDEEHHWTQCALCGEIFSEKIPHETVNVKEVAGSVYIGGVPCKVTEERCACNRIIRRIYTPISQ